MAGYQQSVYSGARYPSEQMSKVTDAFDPPLPPGLEAQAMPGETWQEYYRRKDIPLPPGYDDTPRRRRRRQEPLPGIDVVPTNDVPVREQATNEDDWLMGPPEQIIKEAPPVDERTIAVIQGAPWFERLKASILFDDQSVENWLRDKYSDDSVFRDVDDALYFLPPDEKAKSKADRVWVRFNPEGLDSGDFVSFIPEIAAGAIAAAALYFTGGAGAIPSMLAAGGAGAGSDLMLQGAGAMMADESHVPVSERAVRAGFAGGLEAATFGAGHFGSQLVRSGRDALKAGGRAVAEVGTDPAEMAARQEVMRRTGAPFSVGQETGGTQALLLERYGRQNVLTSDIARDADELIGEHLQNQAESIVRNVFSGESSLGMDAATNAHRLRLEHMVNERRKEWNMLFEAARMAAGDAKVVETSHIKRVLQQMRSEEMSHIPPGDADAIIANVNKGIERLGKGKATIDQLKNALAQYNRISYDGRGFSDKIASPKVQKVIAGKVLDALRKDLALTINKSSDIADANIRSRIRKLDALRKRLDEQISKTSERLSYTQGVMDTAESKARLDAKLENLRTRHTKASQKIAEFNDAIDASSRASESASLLDKARQRYRVLSEEIGEVLENPLTAYGENPEKLIREVFSGSPGTTDGRRVRQIMKFLDDVSPEAAGRFRASAVEHLIETSANITSSSLDDLVVSADKLVTAAVRNRKSLNALFEGDKKAHELLKDFVKTAQVMKDRGPIYGSQTFTGNFVMGLTGVSAAASTLAGNIDFDNVNSNYGAIATDAAKLAMAVFGTRAIARSLFRQQQNSAMRKLLRLMRVKKPGEGAKRAMRQAALDVIRPEFDRNAETINTEYAGSDTAKQQQETPSAAERAMRFAPGGL